MQEDGQDRELKHILRQRGLGVGQVASVQQAGEAKGALEGVLEIVVLRVDGLVIVVFAGKTIDGPAESLRDEDLVAAREHGQISRLNFNLNGNRVSGHHARMHFGQM